MVFSKLYILQASEVTGYTLEAVIQLEVEASNCLNWNLHNTN